MAYEVNTWVTGDPITQEKMNHIERGIGDAHIALSLVYTKEEANALHGTINDMIYNT